MRLDFSLAVCCSFPGEKEKADEFSLQKKTLYVKQTVLQQAHNANFTLSTSCPTTKKKDGHLCYREAKTLFGILCVLTHHWLIIMVQVTNELEEKQDFTSSGTAHGSNPLSFSMSPSIEPYWIQSLNKGSHSKSIGRHQRTHEASQKRCKTYRSRP